MSATMVDQLLKIKKKHWLKSPKAVPQKTKFGPKYNDLKCHIWNLFFENIILGIQFFIFVHTFQWTSSEFFFFFNFRFSTKNSQSQQKLAKKMTHLTTDFRSKNLAHFTNLKSLDIEVNMLPQHSQKPFSLYIFLFDLRKNICSTSFLDVQEPHS